jgi:4-amino-4-deoxy-L-arabinose transferase-like glycosyltransferase
VSTKEQWVRFGGIVVSGAAVLTLLLCCILLCTFHYGRDQGIYAVVARELRHGAMPYRDVFDFKPPAIFLIYAAAQALFGQAYWGIRILEAASLVLSTAGLVILARRTFDSTRVGLVAGAIAAVLHVQLDFWHTGQPESFGACVVVWGLVCASFAWQAEQTSRSALWWWLCGVLSGIALLLKPPLMGVGVVLAGSASLVALWRARGALGQGVWLRAVMPTFATGIGLVVPIALTVFWFRARGAWADLYDALFVFTPMYTKIGLQSGSFAELASKSVHAWFIGLSSLMSIGLVLSLLFLPTRRERWLVLAAWMGLAVLIAGISMQAKFFPYHWGATLPLFGLLASHGYFRLARFAMRWGVLGTAIFAGLFLLVALSQTFGSSSALAFFSRSQHRLEMLFARGERHVSMNDSFAFIYDETLEQNRKVAKLLAEKLPPGSLLFIWGFEPNIYGMSGLPLASRYIYNVPQRAAWSARQSREVLMQEFAKTPPQAIVVQHGDVIKHVTGSEDDSAKALPELAQYLSNNFELWTTVSHLDIYLRRTN